MTDGPADDLPAPPDGRITAGAPADGAPDEMTAVESRVLDVLRVDEPMPAEVWSRLSSALAAEAAVRQRPHRGFPWPVGLAAAAVLVIAGVVLWPRVQLAPAPVAEAAPAAASAGVLAAEPPAEPPAGLTRSSDADAGQPNSGQPDSGQPDSGPAGSGPADVVAMAVTSSGIDYTRANLDEQVMAQLDAMQAANPRLLSNVETMTPDPTQTEGATGFTSSIASLRSCVAGVTRDALALFVDRATYQGQDVGIVVAMPNGAGFEVYVVQADCSASDPAVILAVWLDPTDVP